MTTAELDDRQAWPDYMRHSLDIDSHEMAPLHLWPEVFGEEAVPLVEAFGAMEHFGKWAENSLHREDLAGDLTEITPTTVWEVKGPEAPSSTDLGRRGAVLDVMGIDRQLVFPGMGLFGLTLRNPRSYDYFGFDPQEVDAARLSRQVIDVHNRWVAGITRSYGERVVPVAILTTDTLEGMLADTERMLADGVRSILMPVGHPPAGMSPADRRLDPFWSLLAEAGVALQLHVGGEYGILGSYEWGVGVPEFAPSVNSTAEFAIEPWRTSVLHFAPENFLSVIVLGGVFERHPDLYVGISEMEAHWVGPLCERLDMVVKIFGSRFDSRSEKPSEAIAGHVRVAPFPWEPVDRYIGRHPELASVLCYASDFPHREGGRRSMHELHDRLAPLGEDVVRRFFVDNAAVLFPA